MTTNSIKEKIVGDKTQATAAKYLTFILAGESYGIPVLKVREIIKQVPVTAIAQLPPYIKGVLNLRGRIIPVLDMRIKFNMKTKETLPDSVIAELRKFPAILLGAIGHPQVKPGILEKGILLRLRFELEQYINLRPVKLYDERFCPLKDKKPEDIDFVVVRENNEGLYTGSGGFVFKGTPNEVAIQESVNTRRGVERCIRYAFEYARARRGGKPWPTTLLKTGV